jgi:hypothetical protein
MIAKVTGLGLESELCDRGVSMIQRMLLVFALFVVLHVVGCTLQQTKHVQTFVSEPERFRHENYFRPDVTLSMDSD